MLKVGDAAPDFEVSDQVLGTTRAALVVEGQASGNLVLSEGRHPKKPRRVAGSATRDRIAPFRQEGTVIFGVSFDDVKENRAFAEKFGFPYQLLSDTEREIGLAYGACKTEEYAKQISYLIGPEQKVLKV